MSTHNEWDEMRLKDLVTINPSNLGCNTPDEYAFFYLDLSAAKKGSIKYPKKRINYKSASPRARRIVQNGDILMSTVRPNLKGFGLVKTELSPLIGSTGYAVLRGKDKATTAYVYQFLFSEFFEHQAHKLVVGSNYPALNSYDIENLIVRIPKDTAVRAYVSDFFKSWDHAIEASNKIIQKRESQYIGLRQELIDWFSTEGTPLSCLVESKTRKVTRPDQPYRALSIRSHGKGTYERFVTDPSTVAMEHLFIAKAGDLIVNITFGWEGAIAFVPTEHDGGLVSHRFPTFVPRHEKVDLGYLRHCLRMPRFTYLMGIVSPGGAGRNRVLSKREFLKLKVPYPELKVQASIAQILNDSERLIFLEKKNLEQLKRQKRGLMQKLLTGEWRIGVDSQGEVYA